MIQKKLLLILSIRKKYFTLGLAAYAGPAPDDEDQVEMCGSVPCSKLRKAERARVQPPLIKVIPEEEPGKMRK